MDIIDWGFKPNDRYHTGLSIACENDDGSIFWGDLDRGASFAVVCKAKDIGVTDAVLCGGIRSAADARAIVAALTLRHTPKPSPVRIICSHCGSEDVFRDAWAEWSRTDQQWTLGSVFDHAICNDCHGETDLKEEVIE
jgi:hypothetical protein